MPEEDTSGVHVWLVVWKAFQALQGVAHGDIARYGLCLTDFGILEILLHKGPMPVNAIGAKLGLTSGTMTTAVGRLETRGFVVRTASESDRRVTLVSLTGEGRGFIEAAFTEHAEVMESAARGLGAADRARLLRLLKRLGKTAASD